VSGYIITYMKVLYFVGAARDDLQAFPADARYEAGVDLRRVQSGLEPRDWKPMKGVGAGTREIRIRDEVGAFRVFYVVENEQACTACSHSRRNRRRRPRAISKKAVSATS